MISALFDLLGTGYQAGDFAQAEAIARSILRAIPDDTVALQFLGLVHFRTRRFADARRILAPAPPEPRATPDAALASAQCLAAASGRGSALAGAWYDLGLVLFRLGRFGAAIAALRAALSAHPGHAAAREAIWRIARFARRRSGRSRKILGSCQRLSLPDEDAKTFGASDEVLR